MFKILISILSLLCLFHTKAQIKITPAFGYDQCIQLSNEKVTVIIDPNVGGRILEYSIDGRNVIYVDHDQDGWTPELSDRPPNTHLAGARFDVGPAVRRNNDRDFWYGKWHYEVTDTYSVRLMSKVDSGNQIQLERDFVLDPETSKLTIQQRIYNRKSEPQRFAYWSRNFYTGGGTVIIPLNASSKYPGGFAVYGDRAMRTVYFDYPSEENLEITGEYLVVKGPFSHQKIDLDLSSGWVGYLAPNDLFFTKTFDVYPDKVYGDVTGANFSLWYNQDDMVEIEPIGPWEWIAPDSCSSFSETWNLSIIPKIDCGDSHTFNALDFHNRNVNGFAPAYYDKGRKAIAVNSVKWGEQLSAAEMIFPLSSGTYNLTMTTLLETDGESCYTVFINDTPLHTFQNVETNKDYVRHEVPVGTTTIEKGDRIRIVFQAHTNGKIPEGNGTAYSRGRWRSISFNRVCH